MSGEVRSQQCERSGKIREIEFTAEPQSVPVSLLPI